MSTLKLGINGFGRIGRMVLRASLQNDNVEVVAINDLLDVDHLAYLLKYDSVHGTCSASIEINEGHLIIDGKTVRITAERDPQNLNGMRLALKSLQNVQEFLPLWKKLNFTLMGVQKK